MNLIGEMVKTNLLGAIQIGEIFARGGEGIIYKVVNHNGYLLKTYSPDVPPDKVKRLQPGKEKAYRLYSNIKLSKNETLKCLPLEYVTISGLPSYLMRQAEGVLLTDLIRTQITSMSLQQRAKLGRSLADTMTQLHSSQIVHADVKPSNYVAKKNNDGWVVYVLDIDGGGYFGPQSTHFPPTAVPSAIYQSPELTSQNWDKIWGAGKILKQPDLWALTVLLYQIIVDIDGPFPTRPNKANVNNYVKYHFADFISSDITWPKSWQHKQMKQLGVDSTLIERFCDVFSNQHRVDVSRYRRPEAHDWRTHLDHVLGEVRQPARSPTRTNKFIQDSTSTVKNIPFYRQILKRLNTWVPAYISKSPNQLIWIAISSSIFLFIVVRLFGSL